jgi:hypothetical protein
MPGDRDNARSIGVPVDVVLGAMAGEFPTIAQQPRHNIDSPGFRPGHNHGSPCAHIGAYRNFVNHRFGGANTLSVCCHTDQPPSMTKVWPVTKALSSLAR